MSSDDSHEGRRTIDLKSLARFRLDPFTIDVAFLLEKGLIIELVDRPVSNQKFM